MSSNNNKRESIDLQLYHQVYDLYLHLYPSLKRFPRSEKFLLRQDIERTLLDLLLVVHSYIVTEKKDKSKQIRRMSHLFDRFKLLIRLSHDLHLLPHSHYLLLHERYEQIGKLIGGLSRKVSVSGNGTKTALR